MKEKRREGEAQHKSIQQLAAILHVGPAEIEHVCRILPRLYRTRLEEKKSGGTRTLRIPLGRLKTLQAKIREHILSRAKPSIAAMGGVKGRSQLKNASAHRGQELLVCLDIEDFYPSVRPHHVEQVFRRLGFGDEALGVLVKVTTIENQLPQGSSTSTAIANMVLARLDARLLGLCKKHGFNYTRYIDDLSFSGQGHLAHFVKLLQSIVTDGGWRLKTYDGQHAKIRWRNQSQEVTGTSRQYRDELFNRLKPVLDGEVELSPSDAGRLAWLRKANPNAFKRAQKKLKTRANEEISSA
jgi:RNA-directed DNA polymerase